MDNLPDGMKLLLTVLSVVYILSSIFRPDVINPY